MQGFIFYRNDEQIKSLLLIWYRNMDFQHHVSRHLLPLIGKYLCDVIPIKFPLAKLQVWNDFQVPTIKEWIANKKTVVRIKSKLVTGLPLVRYLAKCLSAYNVLVIVSRPWHVEQMMRQGIPAATLYALPCDPNMCDFVFAHEVQCDFTPRGKFLCIEPFQE